MAKKVVSKDKGKVMAAKVAKAPPVKGKVTSSKESPAERLRRLREEKAAAAKGKR
jgi:hypothetical protein